MPSTTIPDWLAALDSKETPPPTTAPVQPAPSPQQVQVPAWLAEMDAKEGPSESVTVSADKPESFGQQVGDLAANVATGVGRVPGAIIGVPHTLAHAANWIWAQLGNAVNGVKPDGTWRQGADYDESNPLTKHTLSSEEVDKGVFDTLGVKPYEPESFIGKLLQAGVTGVGAGLLDPLALAGAVKSTTPLASFLEGAGGRAAKMAVASDAANATQQAFPEDPGLAALAGVAAHSGASMGAGLAKAGADLVSPITSPTKAGAKFAGRAMKPIDNTQPGIAIPQGSDIADATTATRRAVDDIGEGLDNYTAGGNIRGDLQARKEALLTARKAEAEKNYGLFKAEQPLEGRKLAPFMSAPPFRRAVAAASEGALTRGDAPLTGFWDFNAAGDPVLKPNAAVPPDVLGRIKGRLDDAVDSAKGNVERGDLMNLRDRYVKFLDEQYPNTYPKAREDFADKSSPINQMEEGLPGKVLEGENRYNRQTYTMPQEQVAGAFLNSKALRSDYESLIKAYGGDKQAALSHLQDNLAHRVQGAIQGDGTLSLDAFNRSVRPYTKALSMWFPELAQKFSTAEAAQRTLNTLRTQEALGQTIRQGAMRNADGLVTRDSFEKWLGDNEKTMEGATPADRTQARATVERLHKIAEALPEAPTSAAEAVIEGAPAAVGFAFGGSESGIFGAMFHAIPKALVGPSFEKFKAAYSTAIEKAAVDPTYAIRLSKDITMRPRNVSARQALVNAVAKDLKAGVLAAPLATNSGATAPASP